MSYSNWFMNSIILIIITTVYLLNIPQIAFSIDDTALGYNCLTNKTPINNNYNQSRGLVLIDIISNIHSHEGFLKASHTWQENPNEWSYGLAQCRGDLSDDECKACVNNAALTLISTTHCPDSRSAIIWRDYCSFKYSDVNFFGKLDYDTSTMYEAMNPHIWIGLGTKNATRDIMNSLSNDAINSPMYYASRTTTIQDGLEYLKLQGMVQCNRDLSIADCKKCLDSALTYLYTLSLNQGATVVFWSCRVRFETYTVEIVGGDGQPKYDQNFQCCVLC